MQHNRAGGLKLHEWTMTKWRSWVEQQLNCIVATRNSLNSQDRIDCSGDRYGSQLYTAASPAKLINFDVMTKSSSVIKIFEFRKVV